MVHSFGIYIGNTSACIGVCKDDEKVEIVANDAGERVTPASVRLSLQEQVVGSVAAAGVFSNATSTITNNKVLMDTSLSYAALKDISELKAVKMEVDEECNITYVIHHDDHKPLKYTPSKIYTLIFKKLYSIGMGAAPGQKELPCVLCLPKFWDESSREAAQVAAADAGWTVLQVINEHPAALLAYGIGLDKATDHKKVLVYRLGGISSDVSVISVSNGFQTTLSYIRKDTFGGEDIVKLLTQYLAKEFKVKYYLDPTESRKSMGKLHLAAQGILQTLSMLPSCSRFIESVCEGVDFNVTVSRARFEAFLSPILHKLTEHTQEALTAASLGPSDISDVIVCGAPFKIPKLKGHISSLFPSSEMKSGINPDEVLAYGTARQAGFLASLSLPQSELPLPPTLQVPFLKSPIEVTFNCKDRVVFENTPIPSTQPITLSSDDSSLRISAQQEIGNGDANSCEATIGNIQTLCDLDVKVKITKQHEVVVKVTDPSTKEVKKAILDFKKEE